MKNPLSLEERLVVARRFPVHEILGNLTLLNAQNTLLSPIVQGRNYRKKNSVIIKHLADCIEAFSAVAQDDIILRYNSQREFQEVFQRLEESGKALLLPDVKTRFYSNRGLETNTHLVYAMLFNLMKNSARQKKWFSGINITLEATPYEGQLRNPAYISARTPLEGKFLRIDVHDNGKGFPAGRPYGDYFRLGVSDRGGFGLYFCKLVCDILGGHVAIDSKPGSTTVSVYHPLNSVRS